MIFKTPDEYEKWKKEWKITGKVPPIKPEKPKPNPVHNRLYIAAITQIRKFFYVLGKRLLYLVIFVIVTALVVGILSSVVP